MTHGEFIARFRYKPDGRLDSWRIIIDDMTGDCDDHALTVAYLEAGGLLRMFVKVLFCRTQFYWCRTAQGEAHVMVWIKGIGWIDNIAPRIRQEPIHKWRIWLPLPFVVFKMLVGKAFG